MDVFKPSEVEIEKVGIQRKKIFNRKIPNNRTSTAYVKDRKRYVLISEEE